jgi:hypothetical protein
MEGFASMSITPSSTATICDTIIQAAEQLDTQFQDAQHALDQLFSRTYTGVREGKRTFKSSVMDTGTLGQINEAGNEAGGAAFDHASPVANAAWNTVSAPIQQAPIAAAPTAAPAPGTTPAS